MGAAVDKIIAALENWLRPHQYALGKRYKKQGRLTEALAAFQASESWLIETYGRNHPYVVASIVQQGWCYAKLGREGDACREYARSLEAIQRSPMPEHPLATDIADYLRAKCKSTL